MSRDLVSADEMAFLSKKNRELVIRELLTEQTLPTVHFAIQKGVVAFNEMLENQTKKELTSILVDYQLGNAKTYLSEKTIDSVTTFSYKVTNNGGSHVLMIPTNELEIFYAYLVEQPTVQELVESQLDEMFKQFTISFKNYYKRFTEDLNCHIHVEPGQYSQLNIQTDNLDDINLDELCEIKIYELQFDDKRVHMIHVSDLEFIEYAYEALEADEEEIYYEDLFGQSQDELFETNTVPYNEIKTNQTMNQKEVRKPQFSNFDDQVFDNGKHNLGLLYDVPLELSVVLGKTKRSVKEVLEINTGKIIELNKYADDPLEIYVNGKLIAEGEVVVVDENFGVRVTKLFNNELNFKANKR